MNDFTKEELDSLLHCVDIYIDGDTLIKHHYREISCKIQSLMDNYCEHEWMNATFCEKCGKRVLE
jgi:hypothetical protein